MTSFDRMDHLMMRNGSSYIGKLTTQTFRMKLDGIDNEVEVDRGNIVRIEIHNDYGMPLDEIVLHSGSKVRGRIQNETITFHSEELGELTLQTEAVLTIQLLSNL